MTQTIRRKVPRGSPIFPNRPRISPQDKARRRAENEAFVQRCRAIFWQVYPELVTNYYNWSIMIEPDSGDYFIDPDPESAFQKARQKHPKARILEKRLNETGTCGRL